MTHDLILLPLEELTQQALFQQNNGAQGENRERLKKCLIPAIHDIQAIECWLSEYQKSEATYRTYRKEAERLLLWAIMKAEKALSSLTAEDLLFYSQFVEDPQPRETWCGPKLARNGKRWSTRWRPFEGPLSPYSKKMALKVLTSLFGYLVDVQYLAYNPMRPVRRQLKQTYLKDNEQQTEIRRINKRIIELDEWNAIQDVLEGLPETTEEARWDKLRGKLIFAYGYHGLLRISEIANNSLQGLSKKYDHKEQKYRWWLDVVGKGSKLRTIPVNQSLLIAILDYRRYLKLSDEPQPNENEPLLKSLKTGKALSTRRINQLIKTITEQAAQHFERIDPEKVKRLKKFSEHWLRHLSCSVQGQMNFNRTNTKTTAGHESERTLEAYYIHSIENLRHDEMEKLPWRPIFTEKQTQAIENVKKIER